LALAFLVLEQFTLYAQKQGFSHALSGDDESDSVVFPEEVADLIINIDVAEADVLMIIAVNRPVFSFLMLDI